MGYHPIDYCVEWFGYPDKVQSSISRLDAPLDAYDTEDEAEITFSYKRGLKGLITLSRCARKKQEEYQVRGSLGTLTGNKAELTITDAKGRQISSIADPYAKQAAFDAQLDTFISTFTQGKDFGDNLIAHLQNMKLITHCYETSERPAVSLIPDGSIS
jgi:predicted dehydrogenase